MTHLQTKTSSDKSTLSPTSTRTLVQEWTSFTTLPSPFSLALFVIIRSKSTPSTSFNTWSTRRSKNTTRFPSLFSQTWRNTLYTSRASQQQHKDTKNVSRPFTVWATFELLNSWVCIRNVDELRVIILNPKSSQPMSHVFCHTTRTFKNGFLDRRWKPFQAS